MLKLSHHYSILRHDAFTLLPDASAGSLLQLARRLVSIQQDRLSFSNVAGLFKLRLKPAGVL